MGVLSYSTEQVQSLLDSIPVLSGDVQTLQTQFKGISHISFGSYTGAGAYGSSNKNQIAPGFTPKFLWVMNPSYGNYYQFFAVNGMATKLMNYAYSSTATETLTWSDDSVSWYSTSAAYQLNASGTTYYYVVAG